MNKVPLYPLSFVPVLLEKVWGGERIAAFKGLDSGGEGVGRRIGESWEVSGLPGHASRVSAGPLAGRTLPDLVREYGPELVGRHVHARFGDEFPLLVKFIDARDDLSVQVHPDDALAARQRPGGKGKTEMWYVIDAEDGASLLSGFSRETSPGEVARRLADGTVTEVLARHAVRPGDVFFLPAGRVHAICAGVLVAEIQQPSDITYRLFDYNRPGLDGKPRPLHIQEALEALDYQPIIDSATPAASPVPDHEVRLAECPWFTTTLLPLTRPFRKELSGLDSFVVLLCVEGEGQITVRFPASEPDRLREYSLPLRRGASLLVPACAASVTLTPAPGTSRLVLLSSFLD